MDSSMKCKWVVPPIPRGGGDKIPPRRPPTPSILLLLSSIIEATALSHAASCLNWVFILGKENSIKYGYRKCGTHARVFSRTLAHGNSKIEIRELNIYWKKARRNE